MTTPEDAKAKAAATYNAAADRYDDPANSFWERFGRATVERLRLSPGARVLDVCCGSGASALPAAETVGSKGFVLGIDLAEGLLRLARAKAAARGLSNVEFRVGDMLDLRLPEAPFDAVIDFDQAVRNPADPDLILAPFNCGDGIHPSPLSTDTT